MIASLERRVVRLETLNRAVSFGPVVRLIIPSHEDASGQIAAAKAGGATLVIFRRIVLAGRIAA